MSGDVTVPQCIENGAPGESSNRNSQLAEGTIGR
jgi:hypothetical protein